MKKVILYITFFIGCIQTNAQLIRSFSNDFLNIGVGAKQLGLSNSVTSSVKGAEAGYWNPAGLTSVKNYEFAAMHNQYFNGVANFDYAAVALPLENKNLYGAVSIIRLGIDNIQNTLNLIDNDGNFNVNNISTFSAVDYAVYLSLAKKINPNLQLGANAKIIRRNIGDFVNGTGFGFDIGAQYHLGKFKFGAVIRDAITTFTAWNINDAEFEKIANAQVETDEEVNNQRPQNIEVTLPKFQLGVSTYQQLKGKYAVEWNLDITARLTQTNDIINAKNIGITPSTGIELSYNNSAFLRGGIGNFQNEVDFNNEESITFQPNVGVGFKYKGIYIDYALTNIGASSGIDFSNVFSVKVKLDELKF